MALLDHKVPADLHSHEEEALIKEARRRQRQRRLLLTLVLVILLGAGLGAWSVIGSTNVHRIPNRVHSTTRPNVPAPLATSAVVPVRPTALAVGPNGDLYVADQSRNQILERHADGSFTVFAGTGKVGFSGDGGRAVDAKLDIPDGMAFGRDGTLYFGDEENDRVRAISPSGVIKTVVGSGQLNSSNGGIVSDGTPALRAEIHPYDVTIGPEGLLYIATGAQVLRLNPDGTLQYVVGGDNPDTGTVPNGIGGPAVDASAQEATCIAFDAAGDLYVFGFDNKTVLMVDRNGILTEPGGTQDLYPRGDGGFATAPGGDVVAMDELSIVQLSPTGLRTLFSFPTTAAALFDGIRGFSPNGIAVGPDGTIYLDTYYGNGFTDQSAIVSINLSTQSSTVLWEEMP